MYVHVCFPLTVITWCIFIAAISPYVFPRLHQLKCAVEAVSILVQLPALLEPLTAAKLSSLHTLLLSALQSATTATCALGNLGLKAMAKMPASTEPGKSMSSAFDYNRGVSVV